MTDEKQRNKYQAREIPIYTVYKSLGVDPSTPRAADQIREASLRMIGALKHSPALVNAIVRAGMAAENYPRVFAKSA